MGGGKGGGEEEMVRSSEKGAKAKKEPLPKGRKALPIPEPFPIDCKVLKDLYLSHPNMGMRFVRALVQEMEELPV